MDLDETETELEPLDKTKVARLVLQAVLSDPNECWPVWLFETADELDRQLGSADREQRTDALLAAAEQYIQLKDAGEKITITEIAREFAVSERSLQRHIRRSRAVAKF
jgi:hypothetical protein